MTFSWQEICDQYIGKNIKEIRRTTEPLRHHFGIDYFTYHRIDSQGKYDVLVDRVDWAECYVESKIFLEDPFLRHPSVYAPGIVLIENQGSQKYRETVKKEGKKVLGTDLCVLLVHKEDDYVEFFGFAGDRHTSDLPAIYCNHSSILSSFASHFKQNMNSVLKKMRHENAFLQTLKGKDFFLHKTGSTAN